MNRGAE
ncbi:Hypothetical protein LLA12_02139 [Lactococcus lactis subsp. lactis]|jgi:hypothetical protein|nr:Hypothetical protein LLA12_02139 [Lactococcus lactis subsp. lactis]